MGRRVGRARRWVAIVIGSVGLLSLPATGRAETPGTGAPVASYGTNGVAVHDLQRGMDRPQGVKVDGAGRIVVVSYAEVPIPTNAPIDETEGVAVAVTRFLPTGARDSSFGSGGVVYLTPPGGATVYMPTDFAVTADSRIYVLGGANGGVYGPWLTRLEADGDLDASFGTGGWQSVPGTSPYGAASLILARPAGGLFLAGITSDLAGPALFVRALKNDGSPDPQFGDEGSATIAEPVLLDRVTVAGFALRPDGGVVVASSRFSRPASPPIAIDALLPNGRPDLAFGAGSRVAPAMPYSVFPNLSLAVHPSGAISLVSDFTLARFLPTGASDPAFNNGTTVDFGIDTPHQLVADGESLDAVRTRGSVFFNTLDRAVEVERRLSSGALDLTFATNGVRSDHLTTGDTASGVAVRPGGTPGHRPVVVVFRTGTAGDGVLRALTGAGALDTTFAGGKTVEFNVAYGGSDQVTATDRDGRGGLWIGGGSDAGTVVHVTANGGLDPGFGKNGVVAFNRFPVTNVLASGTGVLVFGFEGESYERRGLVARLGADGTADPTFNGGAPAIAPTEGGPHSAAMLLDGRIVVAEHNKVGVIKPDGTTDTTVGAQGVIATSVPEPVIVPRGAGFLVVGVDRRYPPSGPYEEFLIARAQLSPGVDDPTFGVAGRVEIPLTVAGQPSRAVRILPTLSGYVIAIRSQVVKLTLTGALDPTFHRIELPVTDATTGPTGSIVIASGDRAYRYLPNGDVDESFGDDGQIPLGLQPARGFFEPRAVEVEGTRLLFIGASYARPNRSDLTIVARDGAVPPGVPSLRVADTSAVENVDSLHIVASIDHAVGYPVRFRYEITPVSASMPGDTSASPIVDGGAVFNEAEIPAGSLSTTLTVPVIDDPLAEGGEELRFRVTTADGAAVVDGDATLTIVDNEPAGRTASAPSIQSRPPGNRGQVMATWTAPASVGAAQPDGYALLVFDGQQLVASHGFWPDERGGAVNGLTPSRAYDVVVLAMNAAGWGTPSARLRVTAGGTDLPESGAGALGLIGRPEPRAGGTVVPILLGPFVNGEPVTAYSVIVKWNGQIAAWKNLGPDARATFIGGLVNGRTYDVSLLVWTRFGPSPSGFVFPVTPDSWQPVVRRAGAPYGVELARGTGSAAPIVRWIGIEDSGNAPVEAWSVRVVCPGRSDAWYHVGSQTRGVALKGLPTVGSCTASVLGWTAAGSSTSTAIAVSAR